MQLKWIVPIFKDGENQRRKDRSPVSKDCPIAERSDYKKKAEARSDIVSKQRSSQIPLRIRIL